MYWDFMGFNWISQLAMLEDNRGYHTFVEQKSWKLEQRRVQYPWHLRQLIVLAKIAVGGLGFPKNLGHIFFHHEIPLKSP